MSRNSIETVLEGNVEYMNFTIDAELSRSYINQFAEKDTNGLIKNLLPLGEIHDDTSAVIANAAFYTGAWLNTVGSETVSKPFYGTTIANVQMMKQTAGYFYSKPILHRFQNNECFL